LADHDLLDEQAEIDVRARVAAGAVWTADVEPLARADFGRYGAPEALWPDYRDAFAAAWAALDPGAVPTPPTGPALPDRVDALASAVHALRGELHAAVRALRPVARPLPPLQLDVAQRTLLVGIVGAELDVLTRLQRYGPPQPGLDDRLTQVQRLYLHLRLGD
jgi:hypothetical protein